MASNEQKGMTITLISSADMTGKAFTAVKVSGEKTFAACGVAEEAVGFLQREVKADEAGQVMIQGITFAIASAAITAGAVVASAAAGKVATATTGQKGVGIALTAATAANDVISVLICQRTVA